jgi:hypothetical protein
MSSQRNNVQRPRKTDTQERRPESSAVEENVQAIKRWERAILHARSKAEQVSDCCKTSPVTCGVETSVTPEQLRDLTKKTDLKRLTNRMDELTQPAGASRRPSQMPKRNLHERRPHGRCRQAANSHQGTAQHLHFAVMCWRRYRSRGRNPRAARGEK